MSHANLAAGSYVVVRLGARDGLVFDDARSAAEFWFSPSPAEIDRFALANTVVLKRVDDGFVGGRGRWAVCPTSVVAQLSVDNLTTALESFTG